LKPLPHSADLLAVAPRVIWFEPAEVALADPVRFLIYLMTYGTIEEIRLVMHYVELDDLREALEHAPPGVMDERSWSYWNMRLGRYPVPPMPQRKFGL
jgi:hypothetical protein